MQNLIPTRLKIALGIFPVIIPNPYLEVHEPFEVWISYPLSRRLTAARLPAPTITPYIGFKSKSYKLLISEYRRMMSIGKPKPQIQFVVNPSSAIIISSYFINIY